jgi:hypothetical protein
MQRVPKEGDRLSYNGLDLIVISLKGPRIDYIQIQSPPLLTEPPSQGPIGGSGLGPGLASGLTSGRDSTDLDPNHLPEKSCPDPAQSEN